MKKAFLAIGLIEGNNLVKSFAVFSSALAFLVLAIAGATSVLSMMFSSLIFGFISVPVFIIFMVCIHYYAEKEKKFFTQLGIIFSIMYGILISLNYYLQLSLVQINPAGLDLLLFTNTNSVAWVIEVLGYFFMGLATLFAAIIFKNNKLEKAIKILFVLNGILGIGGLIGYAIRLDLSILLAGLLLWNIIMPLAAALTVIYFKNNNPVF